MAQSGYTPVSLYYSTTASNQPNASNLQLGELAINITDGKLYYRTIGGVVTLLASATTAAGTASNLAGGTTGAIPYQSGVGATSFLSIGSTGALLYSNGVVPAYLTLGANSYILTSNGANPQYTNPSVITVGNATNAVYATSAGSASIATLATSATNIAGGSANQLVYQTAAGTTGFATVPTTGYVLSWTGSTYSWIAGIPSSSAANLTGGGVGTLVYQSATGVSSYLALGPSGSLLYSNGTGPAFATAGTSGQVLLSGGTGAPTWVNQSAITVGSSNIVTIGTTSIGVNGSAATTLAGLTSVTVTQNPALPLQLATKQYVDTSASAGLQIHTPVVTDVDGNQAGTYVSGGTSLTVTTITTGNTLTVSSHGLSVGNQVVPTSTANGLVSGTPYYVYAVTNANQFTVSNSYFGPEISTLTNGTGLTIGLSANSGVGATLTSSGTGPLVSENYTAVLNDRVLLLGQTAQAQNGVYYVSQVGVTSVSPFILTRATDANQYIPRSAFGLAGGSYFLVTGGADAGESYVCSNVSDIIFGTTAITFSQFATGSSTTTNGKLYFFGQF